MPKFDFVYSLWFLPLGAIIAGVIAWFMYRGTEELISRLIKSVLMGLRFLVWLTVFILLLEPILTSVSTIESPPIITVLQDDSESLVIQKDSNFVRNEYPGLLNGFVNELDNGEVSVQFYGFASELDADATPDNLAFDKIGTDLSAALGKTRDLYNNQNLGAVVLISDGIGNAGGNPLYELDGIQAPIYTVLVGDTSLQKDLKIEGVLHNEIAFLENETPVKVRLSASGYEAKKVTVSLRYKGKVLDKKEVTLGGGTPYLEVPFMVKPEETGRQRFDISITGYPDEISQRNNFSSIVINVLETKVKIAVFAGFPHPDLGALRQALERDDRYEVVEFVHKDASSYYTDPADHNLGDFDLMILHNFPYSKADEKMVGQIADQVKNRKAPLMMFYGLYTDLRTIEPLNPYLGITPSRIDVGSEEFLANFKEDYRRHSTFTFNTQWSEMMGRGGPLYRSNSEWKAKSDAKVFATASIKKVVLGDNYPVFALQNHLGHKNFCLTGENFWRLRQNVFRETDEFVLFDEWLYNNIQWLIVKEDKRKFRVRPVKEVFSGNERILFKGNVYDESYNPLSGTEIKLTLKDQDGKENVYYMKEVGNGQYSLELANLSEGTFSYFAEGKKNDLPVGSDRGTFEIGRSNIEHFQLQANQSMLEQIALRTGGKFVEARNISSLTAEIQSLETLKPVVDYKQARKGFHDFWWILALVIGLLAAEWILRKINSLL